MEKWSHIKAACNFGIIYQSWTIMEYLFRIGVRFWAGGANAAWLEQRRVGSVNKCTRHIHWLGREKIKMRDQSRHGAFGGNLILPSLLAKADILSELANCICVVATVLGFFFFFFFFFFCLSLAKWLLTFLVTARLLTYLRWLVANVRVVQRCVLHVFIRKDADTSDER